MKLIIAPILLNDRGTTVNNLQSGLSLLLKPNSSEIPDIERQKLLDKLAEEQWENVYGKVTAEAVLTFQRTFDLPVESGEQVDEATAAAMNKLLRELGVFGQTESDTNCIITGRIEFEDGSPAQSFRVLVYDRDIGKNRMLLGNPQQPVFTSENGIFPAIRYQVKDFAAGEGHSGSNANLIFEVLGPDDQVPREIKAIYRSFNLERKNNEREVSDLILGFEAGQTENVRIVLSGRPEERGQSEYNRLLNDLQPLLLNGATPADFDQERFRDLDLAANETGWERTLIETMMLSWQLSREASREPQLIAETFYGLLRHGLPTEVAPLPSTLPEIFQYKRLWENKLEDSLTHNIIDGDLQQHIDQLQIINIEKSVQAGEIRRASIGDILAHAGVSEEERLRLVSAYHTNKLPIAEFWRNSVPEQLGWSRQRIKEIQASLELADLIAYDLPLIKLLQQRGFNTPKDLIRLSQRELTEIVTQAGVSSDAPGEEIEEQISRTVESISGLVAASYPTETIAHIALHSNDTKLSEARELLDRFFSRELSSDNEEGFDIKTSPVTTYLETHYDRVYSDLDENNKKLLKSQLQRLQRAFRLSIDRVQTETLLELGLDSAFHVTRFSPEHFTAEFGERLGGTKRAMDVYSRAEQIAGTVLYMYTDLWDGLHGTEPMIMKSASAPDKIPAIKELPEYRDLFGSLELCACGHCQSFYSPAAYFVDLLHMLDRPTDKPINPVEWLFRRRPDLAYIQLTCENTNTRIPYVDLVTEVLESFVANRSPLAFNLPPAPPNQRLPSPPAEELRVNPIYITSASSTFAEQAYGELQEAVFPLTLPLNLPLETTRVYLDHLGTSRAELMRLLDRDPGLEAIMAKAAEILLLSPEEFEIIFAAQFGGASSLRPKTAAEFFGLSMDPTPATLFNHGAPEFIRNTTSPDPRKALIRSLQNILDLISPQVIPDKERGIYGGFTEAAVNAYLLKKGLPQNGRTDDTFWGAMEGEGMHSLSVLVSPVLSFLDRTHLTYVELGALVETRFVNPALQGEGDFDYLSRLGIPAEDVRKWIVAGLNTPVPVSILNQLTPLGEDPVFFTSWVEQRKKAVVINTGFEAPCDPEHATIIHLDGTLLSLEELITLFRFVRLWKKLGWKLEDMDHAMEPSSFKSSSAFNTALLLANIKQLHEHTKTPIEEIVCLWQTIPVYGERSLFDRLFRNRAAQLIDSVLQLNRSRSELQAAESATPPTITDHAGSLLSAFRLSAQDLIAIRKTIGLEDDPSLPPSARPVLNLAALSAIYRYVTLAQAARLTIQELISLIDLSGLLVFERPDRFPEGNAVSFVRLANTLNDANIRVSELDYICREVPQPPGLPGTQRDAWHRTLSTLIDGLQTIEDEEPIEDDPAGEELIARLTGLLGPEDARTTTSIIYGKDTYTASLTGFPVPFTFPAAIAGRISYDASRNQLKLRGAMSNADRTLLLSSIGVPASVNPSYNVAIKSLDMQPRTFVGRALSDMFLPSDAEALLIDISSLDADGTPVVKAIHAKVEEVAKRRRNLLSRSFIKQTLSTNTGFSADATELLLENEKVLKALSGTGTAIKDFQTLKGDGLDAEYFANPLLTAPPTVKQIDKSLAFEWAGNPPATGVPATGFSVRWTGELYVPATGEVTFQVRCTDGVRVKANDKVIIDKWTAQPETEFNAKLRLDGGQFYPFEVSYFNTSGDARIMLSWSSPAIRAEIIQHQSFYSSKHFKALLQRIERFYKLALLLLPFKLTAQDLLGLSNHGDLSLDLMPLEGPAPLLVAKAMFDQWLTLKRFTDLRNKYLSSELSLFDVMNATSAEEALARFFTLSGIPVSTTAAIVEGFTVPVFDAVTLNWSKDGPVLSELKWWCKISEALDLVQITGAAPEVLFAWARSREINQLPMGPETLWFTWKTTDETAADRRPENSALAQEVKNIVRARYSEDKWRTEARLLNDVLRTRRRSALSAYVLAMPEMMQANVTNSGRLFEYLLIDAEMEPCMETSRLKQGISSVQLFIQRVLLNLESPQVLPAKIDRARWEWMKNYRVWEAHRKVFLYPESYLEEELRDDKTPFFKELESELLQDELNESNAERAFRLYLEKLDDVAKLIVCGTCVDGENMELHVFARTATSPFVFYHRCLDNKNGYSWTEGVWSPWQKLPVDVASIDDGINSGAHLMPLIWNRRVYLFWPLFEQKPDEKLNATMPEGFDEINCWHIKLAWSEYKDGRWSPKQTGVPFLISHPLTQTGSGFIRNIHHYTANVVHHPESYREEFTPPLGSWEPPPGHPNYEKYKKDNTKIVPIPAWDEVTPLVINDNPLLNGTKIEKAGDWVHHVHEERITQILSLLPKPGEHYMDAQFSNSALTIRLFCRCSGITSGKNRTETVDTISVVRDGQRTDRKDRTQEDAKVSGSGVQAFQLIGVYSLPTCTLELEAVNAGQNFDYNSLQRPERTTNSFMALRHIRLGFGKTIIPLKLTTGAEPILNAVPVNSELIDCDNKSGFQRNGPFFYQDQKRCYLVVREARFHYFGDNKYKTVYPDAIDAFSKYLSTHYAINSRKLSVAPDATVKSNSWAKNALEQWSVGPGIPAAYKEPQPAVMHTMSGSGIYDTSLKESVEDTIYYAVERSEPEYIFIPHWHPYPCNFIASLNQDGLPGLFTLENQNLTDQKLIGVIKTSNFSTLYKPDPNQVEKPYPLEKVDFTLNGSYSKYNWETFFHAPMTIAVAHSRAGKHEEAIRWYHFVFDPMTADPDTSNHRFWRFKPFRDEDNVMRIEETVQLLAYTGTDAVKLKQKAALQTSIKEWMTNPFNPHMIARLRPGVYMKYVFMKYLDNLIAWGDDLFNRDTIESINEATQLYILAANLLGPKPQRTPSPGIVSPKTYQELRGKLDELSNAQFDLETRLPFTQLFSPTTGTTGLLSRLPQALYFCLPQNDKMLAYWDIVADRLFKIRHCINMEGTTRELPLFEPPIDPMLLVEAVAHGLDIGSVLNDLYAPLPRYRFTFTLQQALAICNEVRALGNALLSVIEKGDAEMLSILRAGQETQLLNQVRANKKLQINEAEESRQALENTARMVKGRIEYYENLIAQGLISEEGEQLVLLSRSNQWQETASWTESTANGLNMIPNVSIGGKPTSTFGGSNLGSAASAVGKSFSSRAASLSYLAGRASITGGHTRRAEEWRFQRDQAKKELNQVERQKAAASIRKEITQADLSNHETQLEHSRNVEELLRTKFTNKALYNYLEGSLRMVYFQCYQTAYEIAKRAERCWQYERGLEAGFIKYGAWDSSVKGLLAGERLYLQIKQMERAYLEQQVREYEITKNISLVQLDPLALIELKESGKCEVEIPEWLFDLDYPGHYFRRLKNVSISIPAVIGPFTSLSASLTLLSSKVRESGRFTGNYNDDENYRPDHLAVESIAVSSGQNETGRFQLDFRDDKYLPFEGAGAISKWRLELPLKFRSFDYDSIADVVLQLKYTSRGDETLKDPAIKALEDELNAAAGRPGRLFRFFSLRHEFPSEWHLLSTSVNHTSTFTILKERFPLLVQGVPVIVKEIHAAMILKEPRPAQMFKAVLTPGTNPPVNLDWPAQKGLYRDATKTPSVNIPVSFDPVKNAFILQITQPVLANELDNIKDILIVLNYSIIV